MNVLIDEKLLEDPKMLALAAHMGWTENDCVGRLARFWIWCQHQTETGNLSLYAPAVIARAVGCAPRDGAKLIAGMMLNPKDSFLVNTSRGLHVRSWWKYTGRYWQIRYKQHPERWQAIRAYCEKLEAEIGSAPIVAPAPSVEAFEETASQRETKNIPRDAAELTAYGATLGLSAVECEKCYDHYTANGWVQGRNKPIKDWRAAVRNWKKNVGTFTNGTTAHQKPAPGSQQARAEFQHDESDVARLTRVGATFETLRDTYDKRS